jgi:osmoprotectant transport system ATP-binding protein
MDPIVFEKVVKAYDDKVAVKSLDLAIEPNKTTAIIGPSGSGKSTVIQLINGLVRPDRGKVCVFGAKIDYDNLPTLRKQMGYAVQGTGLFPHLTAHENITLLARLDKWADEKILSRTKDLMSLVDLPTSYSCRYPFELSGGEQQRVGLCRAMMLDPKVLLLDEPFGALDPITRTEIHREFLKLQKFEARTMVLVTHDLREALKLADDVVILRDGAIEQKGSRHDILQNPASSFVEDFVHTQLQDDFMRKRE